MLLEAEDPRIERTLLHSLEHFDFFCAKYLEIRKQFSERLLLSLK
jgi:hypothetical protein